MIGPYVPVSNSTMSRSISAPLSPTGIDPFIYVAYEGSRTERSAIRLDSTDDGYAPVFTWPHGRYSLDLRVCLVNKEDARIFFPNGEQSTSRRLTRARTERLVLVRRPVRNAQLEEAVARVITAMSYMTPEHARWGRRGCESKADLTFLDDHHSCQCVDMRDMMKVVGEEVYVNPAQLHTIQEILDEYGDRQTRVHSEWHGRDRRLTEGAKEAVLHIAFVQEDSIRHMYRIANSTTTIAAIDNNVLHLIMSHIGVGVTL
jgi:hypothetical protein